MHQIVLNKELRVFWKIKMGLSAVLCGKHWIWLWTKWLFCERAPRAWPVKNSPVCHSFNQSLISFSSSQSCFLLLLPRSAPGLYPALVPWRKFTPWVSWTNPATNIPAKCNSLERLQSRDPEKHSPAGVGDNSCQVSGAVCKKSRTGTWLCLLCPARFEMWIKIMRLFLPCWWNGLS